MKIARTIGLAALAALALMASLGAGTALAAETTLCKTAEDSPYCESGDRYAKGTAIEAGLTGSMTINNDLLTLKCSESSLSAKTAAVSGDPLPVDVSTWSLGKCVPAEFEKNGSCTVTLPEADDGSLAWSTGGNGTLGIGASWRLKCTAFGLQFMNCTLEVDTDAALTGGSQPKLQITGEQLSGTGPLCPSEASMTAAYGITSPQPAYVGKVAGVPGTETQLCKVAENPCVAGNKYTVGTLLTAESDDFKIITNAVTFECDEASVTFEVQDGTGKALPLEGISSSFESCGLPGLPNYCQATGDYGTGSLAWSSGYYGSLSAPATWKFGCGGPFKNQLQVTFALSSLIETTFFNTGYSAEHQIAGFGYSGTMVGECAKCTPGLLTADFEFASPTPLYVVHQ